jgi:hypothetical protein
VIGVAELSYRDIIVNQDGTPNPLLITRWNSLRTDLGKALDAAGAKADLAYQKRGQTSVRVVTAGTVTITNDDVMIVMRKTTGSPTPITLPVGVANRTLIFKDGKGDADVNPITITPASGTIDGAANLVLNVPRDSVTLIHDGTEWTVN